jgi:hypothetical protein
MYGIRSYPSKITTEMLLSSQDVEDNSITSPHALCVLIHDFDEQLHSLYSIKSIMLQLTNIDEVLCKGEQWLETNKKTFFSETDTGITFKDNFADLLLLELSNRW